MASPVGPRLRTQSTHVGRHSHRDFQGSSIAQQSRAPRMLKQSEQSVHQSYPQRIMNRRCGYITVAGCGTELGLTQHDNVPVSLWSAGRSRRLWTFENGLTSSPSRPLSETRKPEFPSWSLGGRSQPPARAMWIAETSRQRRRQRPVLRCLG